MDETADIRHETNLPESWMLTYQEIANNVYRVRLEAKQGSVIEITGSGDLDEMIARCVASAREINKRLGLA